MELERFETEVTVEGPDRMIVSLIGELDLGAVPALWARLEPLFGPGKLIVLDGERLGFLDSSGLRMLARAASRAARTGTVLRLVAPGQAVRRTLELVGAETLIDLRPTVAQALAA